MFFQCIDYKHKEKTQSKCQETLKNFFSVSEDTWSFWHLKLSMMYLLSHLDFCSEGAQWVISNISPMKTHFAFLSCGF